MKRLNKIFALVLVAALLVGIALPTSVLAYVEPGTVIPDGEYSISYRYVKDGTSDNSAADTFLQSESGKLIIKDGKAVFEHEALKPVYNTFAYLATRKVGAAKAQITTVNNVDTVIGKEGYEDVVVRDSDNPDKVIIQYTIEDIWKKQDILMHINDIDNYYQQPVRYNHWYNAQLEIRLNEITLPETPGGETEEQPASEITEELFVQRIAEGKALLETAEEGEYDGTYPANSKAKLQAKLELAESLVTEESGSQDILEAAYKIADQAIKNFQSSKIVVDKSQLIRWISIATAWVEGKIDGGVRESGVPNDIRYVPVSDGEYLPVNAEGSQAIRKGPVTKIKEHIVNAQLVVDDQKATRADVNTMFNTVNGYADWELLEKQRLSAYDIEIMVLDSLDKNAQISPYANEISSHAVMLQQKGPGYYQAFANYAFYNTENTLTDNSVRTVTASAADGLFSRWASIPARAVKNPDLTNTPAFGDVLAGEHHDTIKVYQSDVRSANREFIQTDELWQGLTKLQYPMELPEAERKTVFISFNKAYLDTLKDLVAEAQELAKDAKEGTEVGQHSAYYISQLTTAIAAAQEIADQLSAPRPAILKATTALQTAIDTFKAAETKQVYFSAVHSSKAEFSRMIEYFQNPALVTTDDDGGLHVSFTITGSSSVPEFKVKTGEEFVAATTVIEDENNDTRVVTFELDSLSSLVNAQVRTVVPEQNYDRTHDIRLNFNNVDNEELYELIQTAISTYNAAAKSEQTGEYFQIALTALSNAITLANEEAVRIPSQQATTDEAHQRLSKALETFKTTVGGGTENPGTNPENPIYPADGNYYIPFTIYKYGTTQNSVAHEYVVSTALVTVSGNTKTVTFKVKKSAEITGLMLNGSSGSVLSTDTANNKRVVSFTLSDLSSTLGGWVKVDWSELSYHHEYDIQFKFHESQATYAGVNPSVPDDYVNPGAPALPLPGSDTENDDEKEEETSEEATETKPTDNGQESGAEVKFADTATHWAKASIEKAVKLGIVNGYADGSFRPNATVTRSEFAVMISRALKLEGEGDTAGVNDFAGIPNWAKEHVARVISQGIIQGYADATFRANEQLSRAQLAVMITRAAGLQVDANATLAFADAKQIPVWAQKEVAAAVKAGLILGKENNRFDANGTATRAEALTLIVRLLEQVNL